MLDLTDFTFNDLNSCFEDTTGHEVSDVFPFVETKIELIEAVQGLNEEYRESFYENLETYKD